jgi:hypothetical protein
MYYSLLVPPTSRPRREMTRKEAREYFKWFVDEIPNRIRILERVVKMSMMTEGQNWLADKSRPSLQVLGDWFAEQVKREPMSEADRAEWSRELEKVEEKYRPIFQFPEWKLTTKTFSLVYDVGMYLGEVLRHAESLLQWQLYTKHKRSVDYQEPVLAGTRIDNYVNPIALVHTIALGLAEGKETRSALVDVFDIWIKKLKEPN